MVNTSKILTVSYGTFSCTLEGFDDSFDTMKAIAEYFRDLAADDRYFGAEPPTPDAEMLARIAQRESARQVAAHSDAGKIVLRAQADQATTSPQAEDAEIADEPEATASAIPPAPQTRPAQPAATIAAAAMVEPTPAAIVTPRPQSEPDSVAAKLQRIRAVVSRNDAPQPMATDFEEDEHADDLLVRTRQDLDAALAADDAADETAAQHVATEVDQPTATPETTQPDTMDTTTGIEPTRELEEIAAADDSQFDDDELDTIADEAVVAQPIAKAPVDEYYEDEEVEDETVETLSSLTVEITEEVEVAVTDEAEITTDDDQEISGIAEDTSILARLAAAQKAVTTRLNPTQIEEDLETTQADEASTETDGAIEDEDETDNFFDDQDAAEQGESPAPLRARVIKLKRADFEAAVAQGDIEESADADSDDQLSDEDEDDLMEELSRVEAELTGDFDPETSGIFEDDYQEDDTDESDVAESAEEPEESEEPADLEAAIDRAQFEASDTEEDVSRLMEKANTELDEPEANRRRSAIAHLRAAVAATKAEKSAGGALADTSGADDAYRDDLDSVVRPRRPTIVETTRSVRPDDSRPAPLKLVAEQRIDISERSGDPIRPRRISLAETPNESFDDDTSIGEADSFTEFAETVGATDLGELLEAAAAYLSFVEGREEFSRPQLMTKVRQVEKEEFSREDGLRLFGKLLREGKIQKLKGGRFTASDRISYKPDARYAGE